jgi:hypothetical protein
MAELSNTNYERRFSLCLAVSSSGREVISLQKGDSILDKGKTAKKFSEVMTSGIRSLHVIGFDY